MARRCVEDVHNDSLSFCIDRRLAGVRTVQDKIRINVPLVVLLRVDCSGVDMVGEDKRRNSAP